MRGDGQVNFTEVLTLVQNPVHQFMRHSMGMLNTVLGLDIFTGLRFVRRKEAASFLATAPRQQ